MTIVQNPSDENLAYSILSLPSPKREFIISVVDSLTESNNNNNNAEVDDLDFMPGDIVGWTYGTPMNMMLLIEHTAILQHKGYQLLPIESISSQPCQCCTQKTAISLIYEMPGEINCEQVYELCLSCYTGYQLTPIYASAEGGDPLG